MLDRHGLADVVADLHTVDPYTIKRHAIRDTGETFQQHSIQLFAVTPDWRALFRQARERLVQQVCELLSLQINAVLP